MKNADDGNVNIVIVHPALSWPKKWCVNIPFHVFVLATDSSATPLVGKSVKVSADNNTAVHQLNPYVTTNVAGRADVLMDFSSIEDTKASTVALTAEVVTDTGSPHQAKETVTIDDSNNFLLSVDFPASLSGVIDDDIYNKQNLIVSVTTNGDNVKLSESDMITLYWGNFTISSPLKIEDKYVSFDLNGREDLFQNGIYKYCVSVTDMEGKTRFSDIGTAVVQRAGVAILRPYLPSCFAPDAESIGLINRSIAMAGVEVHIPNDPITMPDTNITYSAPIKNASSGMFIAVGYNSSGEKVVSHFYYLTDMDEASREKNPVIINMKETAPQFFNSIEKGRVTFFYTLMLDGIAYSVNAKTSYAVNLTPPLIG